MKSIVLFFLSVSLLTGCARLFSERADSMVDTSLTFDQLKRDPKAFVGKYVKLGGIIVQTINTKAGSQIEIVQFKLKSNDIPNQSATSGGRFLAVTPDYLDSMVYGTGRPVTLIGVVTGEKTLPLSEMEYTYPVVSIVEIHAWRKFAEFYYLPPKPLYYHGFYNYWGPYQ